MAIEIYMPALSPTMEEGTLAKWLVKEGDTVESGDIIAEIETDKATMEVESIDDGVVAKILIAEGSENVPVGNVIAVLAEEDEEKGVKAARNKYTSSDFSRGEVDDPSLARAWPDFDTLWAQTKEEEPLFLYWTEQLYAPLFLNSQWAELGDLS